VGYADAQVEALAVLMELSFLNGRQALGTTPLHALRTL
jgi:adenine phosphoribosyltransferase